MDYLSFEADTNLDLECLSCEDFGLAKSFRYAPLQQLVETHKDINEDQVDRAVDMQELNEIKVDGFCFKLAPSDN